MKLMENFQLFKEKLGFLETEFNENFRDLKIKSN